MPRPFVYNPPQKPLQYIYKDDYFLIINKPAGLLSVPGKPDSHKDCLETPVQNEHPTARIIHRLDMATSGIMVMAMHKDALRHIGMQFERRYVEKPISPKFGASQRRTKAK